MYLQAELSTVMIMFFSMHLLADRQGVISFVNMLNFTSKFQFQSQLLYIAQQLHSSVVRGTVTFERQT